VSLTVGTGPFSGRSPGRFNFEAEPATGSVLFWDPVPHRIRATFAKQTVVDSTGAKLLHETKHLPVYYFPEGEVRMDLLVPSAKTSHCPHKGDARYWSIDAGGRTAADAAWAYPQPIGPASFLAGHVAFYWKQLDGWFAEDEELFGHPRDPYSRIDVYPTSRRVRVLLDGEVLADTARARILFESNLPPRYYIPSEDVRTELLAISPTRTRCAYKGLASYWHVRVGEAEHDDLAWAYPEPQHDAAAVRGLIAFFNERVDVEVEGEIGERPVTPWSR
jgi:uncharacterized protein (DUF427 family)